MAGGRLSARAGGGSVFLLTDYGYGDELAGVLRAVVQGHAPDASVVDLTHDVAPFDVRAGGLALARAVPYLGPGVVVAVVDPGVGTGRRAVAVEAASPAAGPGYFVGPDNGVLSFALDLVGGASRAVALPPSLATARGVSTFDGRDVFAPAAARLWEGGPIDGLGEVISTETLVHLAVPHLHQRASGVDAEVVWVDRFGNAQLAATAENLGGTVERFVVEVGGTKAQARFVANFAALDADEIGVMVDANEKLSLVCNQRPAATVLGVRVGDVVTLEYRESTGP
jgi:S-adenosyl-L-methionine hydrolase (adenosine-forming)